MTTAGQEEANNSSGYCDICEKSSWTYAQLRYGRMGNEESDRAFTAAYTMTTSTTVLSVTARAIRRKYRPIDNLESDEARIVRNWSRLIKNHRTARAIIDRKNQLMLNILESHGTYQQI